MYLCKIIIDIKMIFKKYKKYNYVKYFILRCLYFMFVYVIFVLNNVKEYEFRSGVMFGC